MKNRPLLIAASLLIFSLSAAEPSREWTDEKGRKLTGTLVDKSETEVEVLMKTGKRVKIKLSKLSKPDQEYVTTANVLPAVEMTARTIKVDSNEAGTKSDRRSVEVTLSDVRGRSYTLEILWLGPKGNTVDIYKKEVQDISEDGNITFSVEYRGIKNGVGPDYKGYAVALREDGDFGPRIVATASSQKPFERFLKESTKSE